MKKIFKAKVSYMVKENHPDYKYVLDPTKELTFQDEYHFTETTATKEAYENYIKNDLFLVANGGYETEIPYITNVNYEISDSTILC